MSPANNINNTHTNTSDNMSTTTPTTSGGARFTEALKKNKIRLSEPGEDANGGPSGTTPSSPANVSNAVSHNDGSTRKMNKGKGKEVMVEVGTTAGPSNIKKPIQSVGLAMSRYVGSSQSQPVGPSASPSRYNPAAGSFSGHFPYQKESSLTAPTTFFNPAASFTQVAVLTPPTPPFTGRGAPWLTGRPAPPCDLSREQINQDQQEMLKRFNAARLARLAHPSKQMPEVDAKVRAFRIPRHNETLETILVPDHLVGLTIGNKGGAVKQMEEQSRTRISTGRPFESEDGLRPVYILGRFGTHQRAVDCIYNYICGEIKKNEVFSKAFSKQDTPPPTPTQKPSELLTPPKTPEQPLTLQEKIKDVQDGMGQYLGKMPNHEQVDMITTLTSYLAQLGNHAEQQDSAITNDTATALNGTFSETQEMTVDPTQHQDDMAELAQLRAENELLQLQLLYQEAAVYRKRDEDSALHKALIKSETALEKQKALLAKYTTALEEANIKSADDQAEKAWLRINQTLLFKRVDAAEASVKAKDEEIQFLKLKTEKEKLQEEDLYSAN